MIHPACTEIFCMYFCLFVCFSIAFGGAGAPYVAQADLDLTNLLHEPPEC
jgi:hypothetical protein